MSLSDRIRPDVEAAPWVVEEVKALEKAYDEQEEELDATMMAYNILKKENERLRHALTFRGYNPNEELKHHEEELDATMMAYNILKKENTRLLEQNEHFGMKDEEKK